MDNTPWPFQIGVQQQSQVMFFGIGLNQSTKPKVTKRICLLISEILKKL